MSFDDMRKQSEESSFFDASPQDDDAQGFGGDEDFDSGFAISQAQSKILGMTAPQRFIIAIMLLMMACILSTFCLLVTENSSGYVNKGADGSEHVSTCSLPSVIARPTRFKSAAAMRQRSHLIPSF
jgi:hypothetical protein